MKTNSVGIAALAAAVSLGSAAADRPQAPKHHPDSSKWQDLFAPDLSNAVFPKGVWSVRDGVMTATKDEVLWTRKQYENFVLDLEFKTTAGANSGIIVYCSDLANWIPNSVEIQICDDYSPRWSRMPGTWHCAAIFGHLAPRKSAVKRPGHWNRCTVTCKGKKISVLLNGELVTEMDMSRWTSAKKNPDGSRVPPWLAVKPLSKLPSRGHIGLQGRHAGAPVYFRNVKIKQIN